MKITTKYPKYIPSYLIKKPRNKFTLRRGLKFWNNKTNFRGSFNLELYNEYLKVLNK